MQINPIHHPLKSSVRVPGSKSLTNRSLVIAALADGITTITNALFSEDSCYFVNTLQTLGFNVTLYPENTCMTVIGLGGRIPAQQAELFIGNATYRTNSDGVIYVAIKEAESDYVFTVLDLQHRLQPWFPEVSAKGLWRRREEHYATAIRRASAVITGTESGKAEIVQFYQVPPERIKLIPHPTPRFALDAPKENNKEMLTKYHIPEGYLFYPAQFWPHKNHVTLLLAVRILREKHDLILPVVFVGSDGGNLQHVRRVVDELGLSTQVYFLGFVPRQELVGLYRNALALTLATRFSWLVMVMQS